jgi:ribonuclease Z
MKPSFHHKPVNGPFEDPTLYVRLLRESRALLFDAGTLFRLSPGEILKITHIFVTHTHIDHFIGFDHVLRLMLGRTEPLRIYGPEGLIDCVRGKLRGYTWNLIKEYPVRIEAFEIRDTEIGHASFPAQEGFRLIEQASMPFTGRAHRDASFSVYAARLSHDIPCLAYSLAEDYHINIDKAALEGMGLQVGPWLTTFKKAIRAGLPEDSEFLADGKAFPLSQLKKKIATITKGQKLSYVMDSSPTEENVKKIIELVRDSDVLYSEGYFLEEDIERAKERNHLTARMAGAAAREAGVKRLVLMHYSPKYREREAELLQEAEESFGGPVSIGRG